MSHENEQAVRQFTDAFNARDIEALIGQTSPDCVIVAQRSEIEGAFVGPDGVRRWAEGYFEAALAILAERKEGRLSRFKAFSTHAEALEAAGLSEE